MDHAKFAYLVRLTRWVCFSLVVPGVLLWSQNRAAAAKPKAPPAEPAAVDPGEGFTPVGEIEPRHARDIESSDWSVGAETMDRDYTVYKYWREYLGPLGVKKARIQSGWAKTEKEPGKYDWAWVDEIIPDMVEQGVEPWVCLCYGNPVYEGGGGTGLGGGLPETEVALQAWERYVAAFVDRYKKHVDEWEIWNEPRLRNRNSAEAYAKFLLRTAETVRSRQPEATVIGLAMAGIKTSWVEEVLGELKRAGKLDLIDQLTYHPYSYNPDDSYDAVARLRETVDAFAPHIELRQGENGAPSKRGSFGALSKYDWNETRQAKWALRRLLGDRGRGIPTSYFAICDMQYPSRRNYKGLLAINDDKTVDRPKKAYYAVQHLTAVFDASVQALDNVRCQIERGDPEQRYARFAYQADGDRLLLALWRSSHKPGAKPKLERLDVRLPGRQFDSPVWVDLLSGRIYAIDESLVEKADDGMLIENVPVYDSPVLIGERGAFE
jgi:hypothetical protein